MFQSSAYLRCYSFLQESFLPLLWSRHVEPITNAFLSSLTTEIRLIATNTSSSWYTAHKRNFGNIFPKSQHTEGEFILIVRVCCFLWNSFQWTCVFFFFFKRLTTSFVKELLTEKRRILLKMERSQPINVSVCRTVLELAKLFGLKPSFWVIFLLLSKKYLDRLRCINPLKPS